MEVVNIAIFKEMGFSLEELGYQMPLDNEMAEDLLYFQEQKSLKMKEEQQRNEMRMKSK